MPSPKKSKKVDIQRISERQKISTEQVAQKIKKAQQAMSPFAKEIEVKDSKKTFNLVVTRLGVGPIKTDYGRFYFFDFHINDVYEKYSVLVKAELNDSFMPIFKKPETIFLRIDSGCETGQVFGDKTCECKEQLFLAMEQIEKVGEGIIVHIPKHDGRGMGLPFKLATLELEEELSLDTVESAYAVSQGAEIENRNFSGVICILKFLEITVKSAICLATNNPRKAVVFSENGYSLSSFSPVIVPANEHTEKHLRAKQTHLGHINLVGDDK